MTDLEAAWSELDTANATFGWSVGRPSLHDDVLGDEHWELRAYDLRDRPMFGKRSREWSAVGPTELECVREMARCLREMSEGRYPR